MCAMKRYFVVAMLLALAVLAGAQTIQPCLAVYPSTGDRLQGLAEGGVVGLTLAHGQRFFYLESTGLPLADVKVQYKKKELEKLEKKGVKIVVTTKEAVSAKEKHSEQTSGDSSSGQSSTTVQTSAGCTEAHP
jgi:hypothetical protein